ncbi:DUF6481 family protein [Sphingomonas sp. GCM10030256]|uniref:DUF6481 family protein n=1 Tax=Sphingomonas sp. GCM10030256 TaxID=3273427 RepID=UPI00361ED05F
MASFKQPTFQDRTAAARKAKQTALDQLKAKPAADPVEMAALRDAWDAQQQLLAEERAAKAKASAEAKAEKASLKAAEVAQSKAAAELKAARLKPATAEEMKAARDARYAARQARKGKK